MGITVARYDFSEPQQGKDVCDRVLCPMKKKAYCAEGHDIMNVGAMHALMSRFGRSSKNCDFSCVAKNRKSDDFSR